MLTLPGRRAGARLLFESAQPSQRQRQTEAPYWDQMHPTPGREAFLIPETRQSHTIKRRGKLYLAHLSQDLPLLDLGLEDRKHPCG